MDLSYPKGLVLRIKEKVDDEAPWLILADWLEENPCVEKKCQGTHTHAGRAHTVIHGVYHPFNPQKNHHHCDGHCEKEIHGMYATAIRHLLAGKVFQPCLRQRIMIRGEPSYVLLNSCSFEIQLAADNKEFWDEVAKVVCDTCFHYCTYKATEENLLEALWFRFVEFCKENYQPHAKSDELATIRNASVTIPQRKIVEVSR